MKIVADTNVLISALGWKGSEHELISKCFKKEFTLCFSPQTIEEFKNVALRKKFDFTTKEIDEFIEALLLVSEIVFPQTKIEEIKEDSKDNQFLECAIEAKAEFIVSGDKHLLKLKQFNEVKVLNAKKFLEKTEIGKKE